MNAAICSANGPGASSAMWWPDSIGAPETSSAHARQIATTSP